MVQFCSKNGETVAELLAGFFHFYAFQFNYRTDLVTINQHIADTSSALAQRASKSEKVSACSWNPSMTKLAIEDPFETSFNVGHVVRIHGRQRIQAEMIRAACLVAAGPSTDGGNILGKLFEAAPKVSSSERRGGNRGGGRGDNSGTVSVNIFIFSSILLSLYPTF